MDARRDRYAKKIYGTVSDFGTFSRLVPIRRNSVLDGFTERRFELSQEWMLSRVDDKIERLVVESEEEKDM